MYRKSHFLDRIDLPAMRVRKARRAGRMFRTCLPAGRYKENFVNRVNPPYFWRINPVKKDNPGVKTNPNHVKTAIFVPLNFRHFRHFKL